MILRRKTSHEITTLFTHIGMRRTTQRVPNAAADKTSRCLVGDSDTCSGDTTPHCFAFSNTVDHDRAHLDDPRAPANGYADFAAPDTYTPSSGYDYHGARDAVIGLRPGMDLLVSC